MEKKELERCKRCTAPITWETIFFDDDGICNICKNWDVKQHEIDWKSRERQFLTVLDEIKKIGKRNKSPYDCIVPFSGGKDSTFTLWYVVKKLKIKPLVVTFDHGFLRPRTLENRQRTFKKLGVDVITFTPNWTIIKKLMLESLIRRGDFCWHCHSGVYVYPVKIALFYKTPLIIWGEKCSGEYDAYSKYLAIEETSEIAYNRRAIMGMRAEDMAGFIGVDLRDLDPFIYPSRKEMEKVGIKNYALGDFHEWNVKKHVEIIKKELDWQEDELESGFPGVTYEKIECMFAGTRDYLKYLKRGYSRITHLTTLDIRHGRMSREEAMELIRKYEGKKPRSLEVFLKYLGITEDEFDDIAKIHLIPPAIQMDPKSLEYGKKLWDQDLWYKD